MAASKKDLNNAISKGVDKFFSKNDAQQEKEAQVTQEVQYMHKAQEVSEAQLTQDVKDMAEKLDAAEARKTAGRKGFKMQRLNISLTPSEFEYVRIMAAISGKSQTRFIGDLISAEAERNAETFRKAKEIIETARP